MLGREREIPVLRDDELTGVHGEGGHGNVIGDGEVDRGCSVCFGIRPVHGLVVSLQLVHSVDLTDAVCWWSSGVISGELQSEVPVENSIRDVGILRAPLDNDLLGVVRVLAR